MTKTNGDMQKPQTPDEDFESKYLFSMAYPDLVKAGTEVPVFASPYAGKRDIACFPSDVASPMPRTKTISGIDPSK